MEWTQTKLASAMSLTIIPYPIWHFMGVCHPVVIVEDHDGGDAAGGDHEHDGSEVGPCNNKIL